MEPNENEPASAMQLAKGPIALIGALTIIIIVLLIAAALVVRTWELLF